MTTLARFRVSAKKIEEGDWVFPDKETYGDLEIKTRGFTDAYTDARAAKLRPLARKYNGQERIPTAESRAVNVECLIDHCLQDVRGISDEQGNPVSFAQFCDLLHQDDFKDLIIASMVAASLVGQRREEDLVEAKKSSKKPSA